MKTLIEQAEQKWTEYQAAFGYACDLQDEAVSAFGNPGGHNQQALTAFETANQLRAEHASIIAQLSDDIPDNYND